MKLVIRLLSADGRLLGWCEHQAQMRGDACLRAASPVGVVVDAEGEPAAVSVHWTDMNVETRVPMPPTITKAGTVLPLFQRGDVLMCAGEMPGALPPVTVGSVVADIPVATLGARGH